MDMPQSHSLSMINHVTTYLTRNSWILTGLILFIALLMMLPNIDGGLWEDEFITYREAVLGEPVALTGKPATILDTQPMLARLGHFIVGEPWGIRLPSILFGLGTIFLIGLLANDLFGKEVKYLAMVMAMFSPMLIEFSGEGRPYTALAFWGIAFLYLLNRHINKEDMTSTSLLTVVSIFGLLTRLTFLGQLAVGSVIYLMNKRKLTLYSVAILIIVAPFVFRSMMEVLAYDAISTKLASATQPVEVINFTARALFSFTYGYNTLEVPDIPMSRNVPISALVSNNLGLIAIIAIVAIGMLSGFVMAARRYPGKVLLLLLYVVIPSVFTVLVAQTGYTVIREKFLIAALGAYLILLAVSFKALLRFKTGYLIMGLYFIVIGVGFYNFYTHADTHSRRMMIPELNNKILASFRAGDTLVSYTSLAIKPDYYRALREKIDPVIVYDHAEDNEGFSRFSQKILKDSDGGRIFFIDDTTKRQLKDTGEIMLKTFKQQREWTRQKFGRNLSLYTFK